LSVGRDLGARHRAMAFLGRYLLGLGIVALVLTVFALLARRVRSLRFRSLAEGRRIAVIESAVLSPHATLHLVKAGGNHLLLGVTPNGVTALAEIDVG